MKERYYSETLLRGLAYEDDVNGNCNGMIDFTVIDSISGADVAPIRHGHWVVTDHTEYYIEAKCSVCNAEGIFHRPWRKSEYCPRCGAKLDEELESNE